MRAHTHSPDINAETHSFCTLRNPKSQELDAPTPNHGSPIVVMLGGRALGQYLGHMTRD